MYLRSHHYKSNIWGHHEQKQVRFMVTNPLESQNFPNFPMNIPSKSPNYLKLPLQGGIDRNFYLQSVWFWFYFNDGCLLLRDTYWPQLYAASSSFEAVADEAARSWLNGPDGLCRLRGALQPCHGEQKAAARTLTVVVVPFQYLDY